ncbi:MAG: hypothetical protein KBC72_02325 [Acinetobacter sp.]|nr:hypothetical protein [Acinetobacter sp.]
MQTLVFVYNGDSGLINGLTKIGKHYLEFYNKDFHPDQRNTENLVEQWRQKLSL